MTIPPVIFFTSSDTRAAFGAVATDETAVTLSIMCNQRPVSAGNVDNARAAFVDLSNSSPRNKIDLLVVTMDDVTMDEDAIALSSMSNQSFWCR